MKIALVNLSKIEDFSKTKHYAASLEFLKENNIEFLDFFSNRNSLEELLSGFHEALKSDAELVWFIQGGNTLIKFLDRIDWELVKKSKKEYLGTSDFTHLVFKMVPLGKTCFYGPGLKDVKKYFPSDADRKFLVDFLKNKTIPQYESNLLKGKNTVNINKETIVGGHSFISALMLPIVQMDLTNRSLFFEHHYISGEELADVGYFLEAVKFYIKYHKPNSVILGRSLLLDSEGHSVDFNSVNKYLADILADLDIPVYQVDHFKTIIKFS